MVLLWMRRNLWLIYWW